MPISLENTSNIRVTYNTGSNYIIETVKSDLYVKDTVGTISNLTNEPTVISPTFTESVSTFSYTTGTSTTNYTITIGQNTICDILIVAGGGGGGKSIGAGGGGGGVVYITNHTLIAGTYTISVGKGGIGQTIQNDQSTEDGKNSTINLGSTNIITALGGATGQGQSSAYLGANNRTGGSGAGGTRYKVTGSSATQKTGTTGISSTYGYGNNGGNSFDAPSYASGGGGGAGGVGGNGSSTKGGDGGVGLQVNITGTNVYYAGGGGGISDDDNISTTNGIGGLGGGGNGSTSGNGFNGTNGLGGGGGGGGTSGSGGNGGSGIVIIKFKTIVNAAILEGVTHKRLNFTYSTTPPNTYTLTFPVRTLVDVNNNSNLILQGDYNVNVGATTSSVLPAITNTFNRLIPLPNTTTSTVSLRYHLLNPIKTAEGAQWTYSSNNPNVYHLGSVGIGTTSPEYSLDVRGFIYSSSGGYTSSALTKWSVLSDRRIKENIVKASYDKCLENVKNIELYNFNFKDNYVNTNDRHQLGFIAQEVQQIYPKAVEVSRMIMNLEEQIDDLLTLNTTQIDYTLYGSVKCLIQKLENIKIKMEQIKTVYNITT